MISGERLATSVKTTLLLKKRKTSNATKKDPIVRVISHCRKLLLLDFIFNLFKEEAPKSLKY